MVLVDILPESKIKQAPGPFRVARRIFPPLLAFVCYRHSSSDSYSSERLLPMPTAQDLRTFPNPSPERDYHIHMEIPEFTCLCPMTGQPDFATLILDYIPGQTCVELKGLKLYIWSFRNEGVFHEAVTNRILDDLVCATDPRFMRLTARFWVRGGIFTTVVAEHRKAGWLPHPRIELGEFSPASSIGCGSTS